MRIWPASGAPPSCETHACSAPAVGQFFWPGREPLRACAVHIAGAQRIAAAMGLRLAVRLETPDGALACLGGCGAWVTGLLPDRASATWTCAACESAKREAVAMARGEGAK